MTTSLAFASVMNKWRVVVPVAASIVVASSCSGSAHTGVSTQLVSRAAPDSHVLLVPDLLGGTAGWCMATSTEFPNRGGVSGCAGAATSSGPIIAETCSGNRTVADVYALTTPGVAFVAVASGRPIPTASNATMLDGLREVAIELRGYQWTPSSESCPRVTALDAESRPIMAGPDKGGILLAVRLPSRRWAAPGQPPRGACTLSAPRLPHEVTALEGRMTVVIRRTPDLLGRAFLTCVDTTYVYRGEHHLRAALLLDAAHPERTPGRLPAMRSLADHPGVFEAPGAGGELVARRVAYGWLVVEEVDDIGLQVPLELLEALRAAIHQ